jgi:hypothetical protein
MARVHHDPREVTTLAWNARRALGRASVSAPLSKAARQRLTSRPSSARAFCWQANSGGGKSYTLRKIIEEAFGKVQIILLDIEGEFATLREQHDFFLIGSTEHGADLPISLNIASVLPKRLLELQASTILDMSELKAHERILFVKRFLEALVNVPKDLWQPVVIVLDEAHIFCPQKEKCESAGAVIDLASRGRKRGQCLWAATQRISKLNKDVAAECNNKLIGRAILDVDMKRAAEEIGFTTKEDIRSLRELGPGEFFAFGPALARGVNKIRIDSVRTTHPKVGHRILQSPTPAPIKIRELIGKLADLSEEAEQKEMTLDDLKRDNAFLRGQLLAAQQRAKVLEARPPPERTIEKEVVLEKIPSGVYPAMQTLHQALRELDAVMTGLQGKRPTGRLLQQREHSTLFQSSKRAKRPVSCAMAQCGCCRRSQASTPSPSRSSRSQHSSASATRAVRSQRTSENSSGTLGSHNRDRS